MTRLLVLLIFTIFTSVNSWSKKVESSKHIFIPIDCIIDSLVVQKAERKLIVYSKGIKIKEYQIALGSQPVGKKQFEGDGKTPEGLYFIDAKSTVSKFYKNLNISYPNSEDIALANAVGKAVGGDIKIHGLPNDINEKDYIISDWTMGCIGVTNTEIDELFSHIKLGSPILLLP